MFQYIRILLLIIIFSIVPIFVNSSTIGKQLPELQPQHVVWKFLLACIDGDIQTLWRISYCTLRDNIYKTFGEVNKEHPKNKIYFSIGISAEKVFKIKNFGEMSKVYIYLNIKLLKKYYQELWEYTINEIRNRLIEGSRRLDIYPIHIILYMKKILNLLKQNRIVAEFFLLKIDGRWRIENIWFINGSNI